MRRHNYQHEFKSNFEQRTSESIKELLGSYDYEPDNIHFIQPAKKRIYKPDFKIRDKVYIECKGKWTSDDRMKHVWVKEQHPDLKIYLLFQNSNNKLSKRSKTSYGDWATAHGIPWADAKSGIPEEWFKDENKKSNRNRKR